MQITGTDNQDTGLLLLDLNANILFLFKPHISKYIMAKASFLYGIHVANILLENHLENIIEIYLQDSIAKNPTPKISNIISLASQYDIRIQHLSKHKLEQLVQSEQHQGVVVQCKANTVLKAKNEDNLKDYCANKIHENPNHNFFFLILDGIQDPHNLGACIRSAYAMGADGIIIPQNNSVALTNTVCKISSGTALVLPVFQVVNLARTINWLKTNNQLWVYGADISADLPISKINLTGSIAIIMGAEGSGMRQLTASLCDELFKIPMVGDVDSLNVSVATGICLYEVVRQRG